jgi:hypothetical protein
MTVCLIMLFVQSFSIFGNLGISVDCVAINEGKLSLIAIPRKLSSRELTQLVKIYFCLSNNYGINL